MNPESRSYSRSDAQDSSLVVVLQKSAVIWACLLTWRSETDCQRSEARSAPSPSSDKFLFLFPRLAAGGRSSRSSHYRLYLTALKPPLHHFPLRAGPRLSLSLMGNTADRAAALHGPDRELDGELVNTPGEPGAPQTIHLLSAATVRHAAPRYEETYLHNTATWPVDETRGPSDAPSAPSDAPLDAPSNTPSNTPSEAPSEAPSNTPSEAPSEAPLDAPFYAPF
ncbi:hypothetical protein NHX12_021671 [Muraenolepis orangiensis]|uniref:Uncharacterized protein n=1 Tax=Muraenolepis orangiensis TaxID=630683 RepID=A0A9Q0ETM1_9TELE|nr:hypothetical protein NHX12_021671 [Muraenolepis orangiensis]